MEQELSAPSPPMNPSYRTQPQTSVGDSHPLVVHCSDPRYQPHFQDFLVNGLGLSSYALIAVPGGAQFLTLVDYLPKFSWVGWRWLKFVHGVARAEKLILIGHEDCRWYLDLRFGRSSVPLRERVTRDMHRVKETVKERFPQVRTELYFAHLSGQFAEIDSL
jgi:hypothetical protein